MIRSAVALAFCLLLVACGDDEPPKKKSDLEKQADADSLLLKDPTRAGPELERRLAESITVQDGLLIIHDPIMGQYVSHYLPVTTPWSMSCGIGISFVFGTSVTGDQSSVSNDIQINLINGMISRQDCDVIGLRLAKWLKTTLQGDQPAH